MKGQTILKLMKCELLNIFRNRWVFTYAIVIGLMTWALNHIGGDVQKATLALSNLLVVFVPLISLLFTSLYWYYSDRFTQMMLTQPVPRTALFVARFVAITVSLSACLCLGVIVGFGVSGNWAWPVVALLAVGVALTFVSVATSLWISILIEDRMKGVGVVFGIWLYLVLAHDGLILILLLLLRDYPMDIPGGFMGAFSPVGLARVVLLMLNEGAMLLGHTGALVREVLSTWRGYALAGGITVAWFAAPLMLAMRSFRAKDF